MFFVAGLGLSVHGGKTGFPGSVGAADGPLLALDFLTTGKKA